MNIELLLSTTVLQGLLGLVCTQLCGFTLPTGAALPVLAIGTQALLLSQPAQSSAYGASRKLKDQITPLSFLACKSSRRNSLYLWVKKS